MARYLLLGTYRETDQVADAIESLRRLGLPENRVTIMSATPIRPEMLGRQRRRTRVPIISAVGALIGLLTALALVGGTQLLYPMRAGGQPLWPIPPQLIVAFELTMLGTMWATFIGFVLANRLPTYGRPIGDPSIQAGYVGVAVDADEYRVDRAEQALRDAGAVAVRREAGRQEIELNRWWLWLLTVALILGVVTIAGGLVAYDILKVPWFVEMADQPSVAAEQGPRLAAPADAVPMQGPDLIDNQPASQPVPADANSLQRGQVLFSMHCALCHGQTGQGNGTVSGYFVADVPRPADLTGAAVQGLSDAQIFVIISQGFGTMPSLHEDLLPSQRWDVVNWVRTLHKP